MSTEPKTGQQWRDAVREVYTQDSQNVRNAHPPLLGNKRPHVFTAVDMAVPGADYSAHWDPLRYAGRVNSDASRARPRSHLLRNAALILCGFLYGVVGGYCLNAVLEALQ